MGNIKKFFEIILVLQLLAYTLAFHGHPDAETIDFSSPSQPVSDQDFKKTAVRVFRDDEAVTELLRSKQPVIRNQTLPKGVTKTTTYKLEPDGSITANTVTSYSNVGTPDEMAFDHIIDNMKNPEEKRITSTGHRTITHTFRSPNEERRTVQSWSSEPGFSDPHTFLTAAHQPPTSFNTRISTRTYIKPNGERHVIHTTSNNPEPMDFNHKSRFPTFGNINWPTVDFSSYEPSWGSPDTEDSEDGWEVLTDPELEITTKKAYQSWTPKTWDWPEFPTQSTTTTTTTTVKPKLPAHSNKPLPNLEDFLRTQYGSGNNAAPTTITTVPTTTSTQHQVINIEDLPVMEILHNGKPANENILKNLPADLKPRKQTEQVLKIENKYPIEEDIEVFTPKMEQNIRTFSKTHIGPEKPTLKDLDPQMQEVLRKAGINPDDITNIDGDTITKTRTEPDGRIITTTYKVNTVPATPVQHTIPVQHHYTPSAPPTHKFNSYQPIVTPSLTQLAPIKPQLSPISEFLAKLGLTKFNITSRNGHYTKTFIDDNGEVLTATFVLSSPKGMDKYEEPSPKPYK